MFPSRSAISKILIKKSLKEYLFILLRWFLSSKVYNKYFFHRTRRGLTETFCGGFIENLNVTTEHSILLWQLKMNNSIIKKILFRESLYWRSKNCLVVKLEMIQVSYSDCNAGHISFGIILLHWQLQAV